MSVLLSITGTRVPSLFFSVSFLAAMGPLAVPAAGDDRVPQSSTKQEPETYQK